MTIQGDVTVEIHSVALLLIFKDDIAKLSLHYYYVVLLLFKEISSYCIAMPRPTPRDFVKVIPLISL